eukprot:6126696-Pyramimonas_sp.AAC.1
MASALSPRQESVMDDVKAFSLNDSEESSIEENVLSPKGAHNSSHQGGRGTRESTSHQFLSTHSIETSDDLPDNLCPTSDLDTEGGFSKSGGVEQSGDMLESSIQDDIHTEH